MNILPYIGLEGKAYSDAWSKFVSDGCPGLEGDELKFAQRLAWPKERHICQRGHMHSDPAVLIALSCLLWGNPSLDDPEVIQEADTFRKILVTSRHLQAQVGIIIDNAANESCNMRGIFANYLAARAEEIRQGCAFSDPMKLHFAVSGRY